MEISNSKRLVKNTLYLYIRMFLSLLISLYTSRVVLNVLGASDYGVYNLVGGVVVMFQFLNGSMAGATSRFLSFELGKGNVGQLKIVFNSAMAVHIVIALVVVVICETLGLWFLCNKLNIPIESQTTALWLYQFSILAAIVSMTQVPYSALLLSYEKMSTFAIFDIIGSVLRLGIVFLLLVLHGDKLFIYGLLALIVNISIAMMYRIYCVRKIGYCQLSRKYVQLAIVKPMLKFSGLDLYGGLSVTGRTQGLNMLVNMFFGTVANAAVGIAASVQGALNGFATNVTMALKPQIIKNYASGNYDYMGKLLFSGSKLCFLIILTVSLPLIIEMDFVLKIWLKNVPQYTAWICRLTLFFIYFSNMSSVLVSGVHATGDIRGPSLINGTLYLSVVPIAYVVYRTGGSIYVPFALNAIFVFFGAVANFCYTKYYVNTLSIRAFFSQVILKCLIVSSISCIAPLLACFMMPAGWFRLIFVCVVSLIGTLCTSYWVGLNTSERSLVRDYIYKFFKLTHHDS